MIRLHIIAEGQTEETFVRNLLAPHLGTKNISSLLRRLVYPSCALAAPISTSG